MAAILDEGGNLLNDEGGQLICDEAGCGLAFPQPLAPDDGERPGKLLYLL